MLECKSGEAIHAAGIFEAFRDLYAAQYCAIIGQDIGDQVELEQEIKTRE